MSTNEWKSKWNSFNSLKVLKHIEYWKDIPTGNIPGPVLVSIDPMNACNMKCSHCNAVEALHSDKMSTETIDQLIKTLNYWKTKAVCFTGDTKIKLVNGTHKTLKELSKLWDLNKTPFEVYSRDNNGNIVPGIATNPRITREVSEIIELILDNDEIIKCTPDHLFMVKTQDFTDKRVSIINDMPYIKAKDLEISDSLMPLYTSIDKHGYEIIKDNTYDISTHKLFGKYHYSRQMALSKEKTCIHHNNLNKLDNTKLNLNLLSNNEHIKLHANSKEFKDRFEKNKIIWNKSDEHKKHVSTTALKQLSRIIDYNKSEIGRMNSSKIITKYNKTTDGLQTITNRINKWNNSKKGKKQCQQNLRKMNTIEVMLANNTKPENILNRKKGRILAIVKKLLLNKQEITEENFNKNRKKGDITFNILLKVYGSVANLKKEIKYNHKITNKRIIKLHKPISVYCLEVEKYNNFALSAGIFVKNCIGGGGESLLNTNTHYLIEELNKNKIKIGIVTNGLLLDKYKEEAKKCKWIGISVDAATPETFAKMKGIEGSNFYKVLNNIDSLAEQNITEVGYKYLIHPHNYKEIYEAAKIAKEIGCNLIHIRPGGNPWFQDIGYEFNDEMINEALDQMQKAQELNSSNFKVYGITHKFNRKWASSKSFKKCWGAYTACFVAPNGNIGLCCDRRGDQSLTLGSVNDPTCWGSQKHIDIVESIDIQKCPRCTLSHINEVFENVILEDKMGCDFI